ncbi:MAG: hypothetical protein AAGE94_13095 [Acidobacteriota bacterium]
MKTVRMLCLAVVALTLCMPAVADEVPEPSFEDILFGAEVDPVVETDQSAVETDEGVAAVEPELDYVTSSGEAPPVSFYLTTSCGGWSYAGCCGGQAKYRRTCRIVELPWETWTETKCQNTCFL